MTALKALAVSEITYSFLVSNKDHAGEEYYSWSPYVYCLNNPVNRIDRDGKQSEDTGGIPAEEPRIDPQTGKLDGQYTTAQSSVYFPERLVKAPEKMTVIQQKTIELRENMSSRRSEYVTRGRSNLERTMDVLASPQDKLVSQNPVVQVAAVGLAATAAAPVVATIGNAVVTAGNTAIMTLEGTVATTPVGTVALPFWGGVVEGVVKGLNSAPPDAPYLINTPAYMFGSDLLNNAITLIKER